MGAFLPAKTVFALVNRYYYPDYKTKLPQVQYLREPDAFAKRKDTLSCVFSGAATQIRTGDLILTKQSTAIRVCIAAQWLRGTNQVLTPKS